MDYIKKVNEVIEEALTEKTFNLEIVGKIKEIREEITRLQGENEILKKDQTEKITLITDLNSRNNKLLEKEQEFDKREAAVYTAEKNLYMKEQLAENEKAKCALAIDLFKTVFRNTEVRSDIFKQTQVNQNGYTSSLPETEAKTETKS